MTTTATELLAYLQSQSLSSVKFAFTDIDGVMRGKLISTQKLQDALAQGTGFCDVVFGWDSADQLYTTPVALTGWHTGFPDQLCRIDAATLRHIPWQDGLPLLLADFEGSAAGESACPRSLLKRIVARAASMGFTARFAQEFEWFNFQENADSLQQSGYQQPQPLSPGMFGYSLLRPSQHFAYYQQLFTQLTALGVPIEGLHTETGPGVYEAAIHHHETLAAADQAALLKMGVKEIAAQHGLMASFMAKWNQKLPGCSGHIHQSLWQQGRNVFFAEGQPHGMSTLMQHYIAGQLYCLPHIMALYAPTVNSYKRLVEGAWAPTTLSWGVENRTCAIRVIGHYEKNTRVETRVPGADSNPYLAMAAALASGLYGIEHQLPLRLPATTGNAYAQEGNLPLHQNLQDAATFMQQSELAKSLLGEAFVQHFTQTRLHEWQQYSQAVTNWELQRYFEII